MSGLSGETSPEPAYIRFLIFSRVFILVAVHLLVFAAVFFLAFSLRFDFRIPDGMKTILLRALPWVGIVKLIVFCLTGNFFGWWRYVTFADLPALVRASALSSLVILGIDYMLIDIYQIPRSILVMDLALTLLLFGGLRSSVRFSREHFLPMVRPNGRANALFIGADESTAALVSRIHNHALIPFRIIGFVDSDERKRGTRLAGIPVLGQMDSISQLARKKGIKNVLVTAGSLPGGVMRELVKECKESNLELKMIPALKDLLEGNQRILVREVNIDDLLGRDPVRLDSKSIGELVEDKIVMVTGAGGSIGSEICRQVLKFRPASLVLVEQAENGLFYLERELLESAHTTSLYPCIADILDTTRMSRLFEQFPTDVVFHAAAHKHVPLMEINAGEAIKNNVLGTKALADLAHEFGVKNFVLISTDKAVNPTSVMGASKQLAERYVYAISQESSTHFVVVRFGNVLGSAGSVVPVFQEQIRRGGPITVTDERMTRYFMTIPEAAQLVLQAGAMGRGGEIFVLDMGAPMRIVDLARDVIRLSGLSPDDIEITFTGIRPGEKLYEELYFDDEQTLSTAHPKLRAAYHRPYDLKDVEREVDELAKIADGPNELIYEKLRVLVPDFRNGSAEAAKPEDQLQLVPRSAPQMLSES